MKISSVYGVFRHFDRNLTKFQELTEKYKILLTFMQVRLYFIADHPSIESSYIAQSSRF